MRDDYDDDYDRRRVPFPTPVMIAGIVWIGAGGLSLVNAVLSISQAGGGGGGANPGSGFCAGLIGVAFLVCGYQTVTGKATDTRGNAIGSILLGLLQVLIGVAVAVFGVGAAAANPNANPNAGGPNPPAALAGIMVVVGGIVAVVGVTLITAGILALAGRRQYLDWRRDNGHPVGRRGRDRDYDDEDDRPRRRRRRDDEDAAADDDRPRRR